MEISESKKSTNFTYLSMQASLFIYSFVFMCMLYLCVSTLSVEVKSQWWASSFVFLHFVYFLTFETGSLIEPRAHQLARLPESLCLSSNSELEACLLTWVLLIKTGSSCLGSEYFSHRDIFRPQSASYKLQFGAVQ